MYIIIPVVRVIIRSKCRFLGYTRVKTDFFFFFIQIFVSTRRRCNNIILYDDLYSYIHTHLLSNLLFYFFTTPRANINIIKLYTPDTIILLCYIPVPLLMRVTVSRKYCLIFLSVNKTIFREFRSIY